MYKDFHKNKSDKELSDYQKEIEATENVILCVAKAEIMVRQIGESLMEEILRSADGREHRIG